ncbi:hypothetical protein AB205_0130940 [Aquarana catesbeiana]|uniref:BESS domain-containing protein n=1 Tax=Aquarana catesbeiana TaxID=8400 RepID=A0A2G9QF91_AQUCT|nr:hypothetical protein AB205_0130940 [Aquarana catesbeiana]
MRSTVSSVPARARRASISPENEFDVDTNQETNAEPLSPDANKPLTQEPVPNVERRVPSSSTSRRTCRTQQEPPFEEYLNRLIEEMKNHSQTSKDDEFLNISDLNVMFLRMLLSVIREVPLDKCTEVRGDIYAYLMYVVSACKEQRPFPRFQPWGLGFNTPSGSFTKSLPSH